jgi:hypothetical protein
MTPLMVLGLAAVYLAVTIPLMMLVGKWIKWCGETRR